MSLNLKWVSYKEHIVLLFFIHSTSLYFDWYIFIGIIDINIIVTLKLKSAILFFFLFVPLKLILLCLFHCLMHYLNIFLDSILTYL